MHQAWPELLLDEAVFAAYRAERGGEPAHLGDLYLACACAQGVAGALEAFDRTYLPMVDGFVARQRLPSGALDDLKQQLRERLFVAGRIREYSGQGPLANWLRVVAVRAAIDFSRKRSEALLGAESGTGRVAALAAPGEPELDFIRDTYREAVGRAVKESLGELPSEERNVLRLHFIEGVTLDELAALFHVHRATVARRIAAARESVLVHAKKLFGEQAEVAAPEVESLFELVRGRLDVTLSSFLQRRQRP